MTPPDQKHDEIKRRINAREAMKELFTYIPDVFRCLNNEVDEERFWDLVATEAAAKEGKVLIDEGQRSPMKDDEAAQFEKEKMPNGIYKDKTVGNVDPDDLLDLVESSFAIKLRRYVQSRMFKERQ